jgi:hypothetical protein
MAAPLKDFIANVKKSSLARTNRFTVMIGSSAAESETGRIVQLFCEQAALPSISFASQPVRTFGDQREVVYDRNFELLNLTFLVDREMKVKDYFDQWCNRIVKPDTRTNGYYDDYVQKIEIYVQDTKDNNTYKCTVYEAYPKTVSAVTLDNNSKDVMKLQVSFAYRYHHNEVIAITKGESESKKLFGFDLPDPYQLSRELGGYVRGAINDATSSISDMYFSNFSQYQQNINDSLAVSRSLERQGFSTGLGSLIG